MNYKIKYTTKEGNTFKTIAVGIEEAQIPQYMRSHYCMSGIVGYSAKPTKLSGYKKFINKAKPKP